MAAKTRPAKRNDRKITVSVIKADIGGYVGHSASHPDIIARAEQLLERAKSDGLLVDFRVTNVGDDLDLIMTHRHGDNNRKIHKLAWDLFMDGTQLARQLSLYGAGQDMLADSFSGNVKGMGPGCAEMTFEERKSEPIIVFCADKCAPGAWNLPLFRMFADPFNTIGLVIDPSMHDGFVFQVHDVHGGTDVKLACPEQMYDLLVLIGSPENYVIQNVFTKKGDVAATTSTQKLALIAGRYVGKDDPVMIVRCQSGQPR
ncbi:MAG: fructose 1,6-bisphosphatase [Anaerolineales bacterium]